MSEKDKNASENIDTSEKEMNETNSETNHDIKDEDEEVEQKPEESSKKEEPVEMVEIPKTRLEELENAEAIALEQIKRERAESINYRKRLQKQRDEFAEIASARVLTKLLAVQDDLKRILDNGRDEIPKEHLEGIELLSQRIKGIFESENVALIDIKEGKTKYDPHFHEAIVAQPIPGVPENTIVQVISSGFVKTDRVLRPAKVIISKAPPKEEKKEEEPVQEEELKEVESDQKKENSDN